jgi:hypothetical protein
MVRNLLQAGRMIEDQLDPELVQQLYAMQLSSPQRQKQRQRKVLTDDELA